MLTCALFSLTPALRVTQAAPGDALKASNRGLTTDRERFGLRRVLVVTQVALSLVLLAGALLFARSLRNLWMQNAGFQQDGILITNLDVGRLNIPAARRRAFKRDLIDRVRTIPGVDSAANAIFIPISGNGANNTIYMTGDKQQRGHGSQFNAITPGYFKTLNTPLLAGRDFDERDTTTSPKVAIVNRRFSRDVIDGANPIGKRFRVRVDPGQADPIYEIVGLVEDTKYNSLRDPFVPIIFLPESQDPDPDGNLRLVIRSAMPIANAISALKRTIAEASPAIIIDFHVLKTQVRESLKKERLMATLSGFFGVLATVLATIGLYSVVSYTVARRRSEIGIRMAVGAQRSNVVWMVLREALLMVSIGVAIGVPVVLGLARFVSSLLYGLKPSDPLTISASVILLFVVAALASYLPARRASRVDPMVALRYE
jgi:predicted permease